MALTTQIKTLRAMRELLLGSGRAELPYSFDAKPPFVPGPMPALLPRSSPEAEGVPSALLEDFYRTIASIPHANAHALLVLRHGKVVAEGYFAPFAPDVWHVTHSLCKTVTGTAVGIAMGEGLFALDDPVADLLGRRFLKSRRTGDITVRHLLGMSSGITFNELTEALEKDWLKGIFSSSLAFEPGSEFVYNSMNSYLLAALVCQTSGQTLTEYLTPRLYEPMGFVTPGWERCPAGIEKGGWGMYMMPEDMAKLGQLYLQNGLWVVDGKARQLVPEAYVREATRLQMQNEAGEGYGWQLWVDPATGNYMMNGMFGQYITVLPGLDMVLVMTAGNPHLMAASPAFDAMREAFFNLPPLPQSLPENPVSLSSLRRTLEGLRFHQPAPGGNRRPARAPGHTRAEGWRATRRMHAPLPMAKLAPFLSRTWRFAKNRGGILPIVVQAMENNFSPGVQAIRLEMQHGVPVLFWEEGEGTLSLPVGFGQTHRRTITVDKDSFLVACLGAMVASEDGEPILKITVCFLEHSSLRIIKLRRRGKGVLLALDEEPQFSLAIESMLQQDARVGADNTSGAFGDMIANSEYLHYRVAQLCAPVLAGTPVHAATPAPKKNTG